MAQKITPSQLFTSFSHHLLVDVRTPAEFAHGHIPGAENVALFSDEERVIIGTAYKQQGRERAMLIALDYIAPRMRALVEAVERLMRNYQTKTIIVHCWRGGMRSASFSWLLEFFGYHVYLLDGGYKAFRAYTRELFRQKKTIRILSGCTGSQKTKILQILGQRGQQIIDLEALAQHKGSVFGALQGAAQLTQEQFENNLAFAWEKILTTASVWIEDESKKIGFVHIPDAIWQQMRSAPVTRISMPFERRLRLLCEEYGTLSTDHLVSSVQRLEKHLGGARTQEIVIALHEGRIEDACRVLTHYYDATYAYGLSKRDNQLMEDIAGGDEPLAVVAGRLCT